MANTAQPEARPWINSVLDGLFCENCARPVRYWNVHLVGLDPQPNELRANALVRMLAQGYSRKRVLRTMADREALCSECYGTFTELSNRLSELRQERIDAKADEAKLHQEVLKEMGLPPFFGERLLEVDA